MTTLVESFGIQPVINARGYSTKLGGCALPAGVLEAMAAASRSCVRISEFQEIASREIARFTGAEAGIVTSGASAALTLAAAASMTRLDVRLMNRLPDASGMRNEIVVHQCHRNDYDRALLLAGATFVEVGTSDFTSPYEVEEAVNERTAAFFFLVGASRAALPLADFAVIAHRHDVPVIVDAAPALPPATNLRLFLQAGAGLVAFSGGKHLRGPQSTGILCGRKDLVLAAALQHQDMDVLPETWPLRELVGPTELLGPPHHGVGRGFKVGKEEIAGLLAALRAYQERDFEAEKRAWRDGMDTICSGMEGCRGVRADLIYPQADGRLVPAVAITIDPREAGIDAVSAINELEQGYPPICVYEMHARLGQIWIMPESLLPGEASTVAERLRQIFVAKREI